MLSARWVWALPTDPSHFMYPLDREYLLLSGLEDLPYPAKLKHHLLKDCPMDSEKASQSSAALRSHISSVELFLCQSFYNSKVLEWSLVSSSRFWDADTQVLYFGERHIDITTQKTFANLIPKLAEEGFTTLAMEMFPFSTQQDIDGFLQGQVTLEEILTILKQHWSYSQEGYAEILIAAQKYNIRILGIDNRQDVQTHDFMQNVYERDDIMSDQIAAHLEKHPQDKMAVYVGSLHAPLLFDQKGQAQSQIQKLVKKFEVHNKQSLKVQSFTFKRANRNKFLEALHLVHSFSKDEDTMVLGRDALTYFDGILFIHNQD